MKTFFLLIPLFLFLTLILVQSCTRQPSPADAKIYANFLAEVAAAEPEGVECANFEMMTSDFFHLTSEPNEETHTTRAFALEALKLLEKRPSERPHTHEAIRLLTQNLDALARIPDQEAVLKAVGSLSPDCDLFFVMNHLQALLRDQEKYKFQREEKARLQAVFRSYLLDEALAPRTGIISYAVRASLLEKFVEKRKGGRGDEAIRQEAKLFNERFEEGRKTLRNNPDAARVNVDYMKMEIGIARALAEEYGKLAKRAFF